MRESTGNIFPGPRGPRAREHGEGRGQPRRPRVSVHGEDIFPGPRRPRAREHGERSGGPEKPPCEKARGKKYSPGRDDLVRGSTGRQRPAERASCIRPRGNYFPGRVGLVRESTGNIYPGPKRPRARERVEGSGWPSRPRARKHGENIPRAEKAPCERARGR